MKRLHEIRHECLLQLYGSKGIPISAAHIQRVAQRQGFDYSEQELRQALFFLRGRGLCELIVDAATGESRHRITADGMLAWEGSVG
jgi:hypothetical protein